MNVSLDPEHEKVVIAKVQSGEYPNPEALVKEALDAWLEWDALDSSELQEDRDAVRESTEQLDRGEGISLEEFERHMREKHGISR